MAAPLNYTSDAFVNLLQLNPAYTLPQNQELRISEVNDEACQEPLRILAAERLDAIQRLFNHILQPHALRVDTLSSEGTLQYQVPEPQTFSILSNQPIQLRVRPLDVNMTFQSLFDRNRPVRNLRFEPHQRVIFTDLDSTRVTWAGNDSLGFLFEGYLRPLIPPGFHLNIEGGTIVVGSGENGTGLSLFTSNGLQIRVLQIGSAGTPPALTDTATHLPISPQTITDVSEFEEQDSFDTEQSCFEMLKELANEFFESIASCFMSIYHCCCRK